MRLDLRRPFDDERLPGPSASGPGGASIGDSACIMAPQILEGVSLHLRCSVRGIVTEIVSAECDDALHIRVCFRLPEIHVIPGFEAALVRKGLPVYVDLGHADQVGWLRCFDRSCDKGRLCLRLLSLGGFREILDPVLALRFHLGSGDLFFPKTAKKFLLEQLGVDEIHGGKRSTGEGKRDQHNCKDPKRFLPAGRLRRPVFLPGPAVPFHLGALIPALLRFSLGIPAVPGIFFLLRSRCRFGTGRIRFRGGTCFAAGRTLLRIIYWSDRCVFSSQALFTHDPCLISFRSAPHPGPRRSR